MHSHHHANALLGFVVFVLCAAVIASQLALLARHEVDPDFAGQLSRFMTAGALVGILMVAEAADAADRHHERASKHPPAP